MFRKIVVPLVLVLGLIIGLIAPNTKVGAAERGDVVTRMYITDKEGKELTGNISQWEQFRLNADFKLPDNEMKEGDTTTVTLPSEITFAVSSAFEVRDKDGNIVANATINPNTKEVQLVYTDYVEKRSGISGHFFFYVRVDHRNIKTEQDIPIDITVGGRIEPAGEIHFVGVGVPRKNDIGKSGWQNREDPTIGHFYIAINRSNKDMSNVKVVDILEDSAITYIEDSFQVQKGTWRWDDASSDWVLDNETDITNQVTLSISGSKFTVELGNLSSNEGIKINYRVRLPYKPSDGQRFVNNVTLTATNSVESSKQSGYTFFAAGGEAQGYLYKIQLKKVNEANEPLSGATFAVFRNRIGLNTGDEIATVTTDSNGVVEVDKLLNDTYTIREIAAPSGYIKSDQDIVINPADFDADTKIALKEVVNKSVVTTTESSTESTTVSTSATTTEFSTESTTVSSSAMTTESSTESTTVLPPATTTESGTESTTASSSATTSETSSVTSTESTTITSSESTTEATTPSVSETTTELTTRPTYKRTTSTTPPASQFSTSSTEASTTTKSSKPKRALPSTGETVSILGLIGLATLGLSGIYYHRNNHSKK